MSGFVAQTSGVGRYSTNRIFSRPAMIGQKRPSFRFCTPFLHPEWVKQALIGYRQLTPVKMAFVKAKPKTEGKLSQAHSSFSGMFPVKFPIFELKGHCSTD
jgi:hypothetical protein